MYETIDTLWLIEAIVSILMKVLRWSRTISHLFLRIYCIVDDIVHFIWMHLIFNCFDSCSKDVLIYGSRFYFILGCNRLLISCRMLLYRVWTAFDSSTTENEINTRTLDKYIYWAWIKTIENQVLFANELVRHSKSAQ